MSDAKVNTIKRLWTLLRHGYDPEFKEAEERCNKVLAEVKELNGALRRRD